MRTFHTKVGWWYWGIIALFSCFLFVCFWFHELLLTLLFAVIVIFLIEALIHTQYVVTADGKLVIEVGRFMEGASIDVAQIVSIEKSKFPESAPALSLDRLKITYRKRSFKDYILISPQNQEAFVQALLKQNASIKVNI